MTVRVDVVGAGVIGLTCAVRLAEAGLAVQVLARDLPAQTTSARAGAVWLPYRAEPAERVAAWGAATLAELLRLGADEPASGVLLRDGVLLAHEPLPRPIWADAVAASADLITVRDPAPGYAHGLALRAPVIDVPTYLEYLLDRLRRSGGTVVRTALTALPERGIVVNASGLGALELAGDRTVYPVRGQTIVLDNPGLHQWLADDTDEHELTYVIPRTSDVVVGGSATEHDAGLDPDPALADRMLARAHALVPALADARIRAHRVGLRPARPAVRLETEERGAATIVHCYGHGGAGFTLSWGCADEVVALVRALVPG